MRQQVELPHASRTPLLQQWQRMHPHPQTHRSESGSPKLYCGLLLRSCVPFFCSKRVRLPFAPRQFSQ